MDTWLFDLDNTLYPADAGLMDALSDRIRLYLEERLNLPAPVAEAMRDAYLGRYGSSVQGVLRHCQVDEGEFLRFVHSVPVERYLARDPALAELLASLPGRKCVFTNATAEYALRALRALGVEDHFETVFDIFFAGGRGKPSPAVYRKVLTELGDAAGECWFVEDSAANLEPAAALGCHTVWVSQEEARPAYVQHVVRDLAELRTIAAHVDGRHRVEESR